MNVSAWTRLLEEAVGMGIVDNAALIGVDRSSFIRIGRIETSVLLSTYGRRLRHAGDNAELLKQTEDLVRLLQSYQSKYLSWISVQSGAGFYRGFLADSEGFDILFWMKMLDRPGCE